MYAQAPSDSMNNDQFNTFMEEFTRAMQVITPAQSATAATETSAAGRALTDEEVIANFKTLSQDLRETDHKKPAWVGHEVDSLEIIAAANSIEEARRRCYDRLQIIGHGILVGWKEDPLRETLIAQGVTTAAELERRELVQLFNRRSAISTGRGGHGFIPDGQRGYGKGTSQRGGRGGGRGGNNSKRGWN